VLKARRILLRTLPFSLNEGIALSLCILDLESLVTGDEDNRGSIRPSGFVHELLIRTLLLQEKKILLPAPERPFAGRNRKVVFTKAIAYTLS
jgi:hypothetical protein